jgi:hypothetical protein
VVLDTGRLAPGAIAFCQPDNNQKPNASTVLTDNGLGKDEPTFEFIPTFLAGEGWVNVAVIGRKAE